MKGNKGQFTLFVVLGIVIVILLIIFYYREDLQNIVVDIANEQSTYSDMEDIRYSVGNCLDSNLDEGVKQLGLHGGSFEPIDSLDFEGFEISMDKLDLVHMEIELENYLEYNQGICELYGAEYESRPEVYVTINENSIKATIDTMIRFNNRSMSIPSATSSIDLIQIYNLVNQIQTKKAVYIGYYDLDGTIKVIPYGDYYVYRLQEGNYIFLVAKTK